MYINMHFIDRHMSEVLPPERNWIMKYCVVNVFTLSRRHLLYRRNLWNHTWCGDTSSEPEHHAKKLGRCLQGQGHRAQNQNMTVLFSELLILLLSNCAWWYISTSPVLSCVKIASLFQVKVTAKDQNFTEWLSG